LQSAINLNEYLNEERLWSLFRYFDFKDQGYFTVADIRAAISRSGRKITDQTLEEMMRELGQTKEGRITFKIF
jgi:calcium-dependent protein kinase